MKWLEALDEVPGLICGGLAIVGLLVMIGVAGAALITALKVVGMLP